MNTEQSLLWHTNDTSSLEASPMPVISDSQELIIEASYSMISLGTEQLVLTGGVPTELIKSMRVPYMMGEFNEKFTYGYSLVGKVLDGSVELLGRNVHILHPHQHYAKVSKESVYVLPDTLDPLTAVLISNMETAVNAVWDSEVSIGDRVLVVGSGSIGLLIGRILSGIAGVQVQVSETDTTRRRFATEFFADKSGAVTVLEEIEDDSVDIAFNTGKSSESLQSALDAVSYEGLVVDVAWHGANRVSLDLGSSFHLHRKRIIGSQVSRIPNSRSSAWTFETRKDLVARLLSDLDCSALLTQRVRFEETPAFFNSLRHTMPDAPGIVIDYQEN